MFSSDLPLITTIVLPNPPTKYTPNTKKVKLDKKGNIAKPTVHYLTANIFYSTVHFFTKDKIVRTCKEYLMNNLPKDIPKLRKCKLSIIYRHNTDTWDLDNKLYFWQKIFLDLLKTPTDKQVKKSLDYKKEVLSLRILKDDTVRYVDEIHTKFERGEPALIIRIYGIEDEVQQELFT